ncbi:MAG TPA: hypothetical protein VET48_14095 [Steroidobacteraceae bacterium]|nr:hypothetical protein [Steroidobacteraceae bacterium]
MPSRALHSNISEFVVRVATMAVGAITFVSVSLAADVDELGDLVARAQFDYYAADSRSLTQDVQAIGKLQVDDSLARTLQYQIAYGNWKLAEITRGKNSSVARHALDSCDAAAEKGLALVPKRATLPRPDVMHAELLAIQAGCALVDGETHRAGKLAESALVLQPSDPRILLVNAAVAISHAKSAKDQGIAEQKIAAAVAAFDAESPLPPGTPDWGHAEALARLGALQLQRGNRVSARNSIERALVLAADYVWARELLVKITDKR